MPTELRLCESASMSHFECALSVWGKSDTSVACGVRCVLVSALPNVRADRVDADVQGTQDVSGDGVRFAQHPKQQML